MYFGALKSHLCESLMYSKVKFVSCKLKKKNPNEIKVFHQARVLDGKDIFLLFSNKHEVKMAWKKKNY